MEGEWTIWAGKRKAVLHAGDAFTVPTGTGHTVAATGDGPGRIGLRLAAGFARLIAEVGTPEEGGRFLSPWPRTWTFCFASPPRWAMKIPWPSRALPHEFAEPRGER